MNSSDIDTNKCRCFWNCSALVSLYQDLNGYNMIKFLLMITVFHSLLDGLSSKTINSKSLAAWGNNCSNWNHLSCNTCALKYCKRIKFGCIFYFLWVFWKKVASAKSSTSLNFKCICTFRYKGLNQIHAYLLQNRCTS